MSDQSPSANSRGQRGADVSNREPNARVQDDGGVTSDLNEPADDVPPSADIEKTDDPSKD